MPIGPYQETSRPENSRQNCRKFTQIQLQKDKNYANLGKNVLEMVKVTGFVIIFAVN